MQKVSLLCLCLLLSSLCFVSCDADSESGRHNQRVLATFQEMNVGTRANGATWEDGDLVGIYCVTPGQNLSANNYADNRCYRYKASIRKFEPATSADEIYFGSNDSFTFYAYYPYRTDMINPTSFTHAVGTSQGNLADHRNSDLITGRSTQVNNDGTVMMDFYHAMTLVELNWNAGGTPTAVTAVNARFRNNSVVNLSAPAGSQVLTTGDITEIPMYRKAGDDNVAQYEVYVPPTAIIPGQELFIPCNGVGDKLSEALCYSGASAIALESGKKYNLSGTLFEITATVADGNLQIGFSGGMYFRGRECIIKADRTDDANPGCKFVGFYEENISGGLSKITDSGITSNDTHAEYRFIVNANRRIKAIFTHEYSEWVANEVNPVPGGSIPGNITVSNQTGGSISPDGVMRADGKNISIRAEGGQFRVTANAIREIRLNGTVIGHEYVTNLSIRNNSSVSGFSWSQPLFSATPNADLNPDGSIKGQRQTTLTIIGPDGLDISAVNGGVVNINQSSASWVNNWSIQYSVSGNPIPLLGGSAQVTCYAINNRSLAGVTNTSYIQYAEPVVSSDNSAFTRSATTYAGSNNWQFTISAGANYSTARSTNVVLAHGGATANFSISQSAGVKVYLKPVITFTAKGGTNPEVPLSSAEGKLSVLTYTVSVSYQWNGVGEVFTETMYPVISGSGTGFIKTENGNGKSVVRTEANKGDARNVTYTATFSIGGQTADPVSVTIYQARAWNVDV